MVDPGFSDTISKYPRKRNENTDTDTLATEETSDDSLISSMSSTTSDNWDLSWYECFRLFETKQIERKTLSSDIIDENCRQIMGKIEEDEEFSEERENCVLVPPAVLTQMEVVKEQMIEYNTMLEVCEETLEKNVQLQEKIQEMKSGHDELRVQYESRMKKQVDKWKKMNSKYSTVEVELEKMKKKLASLQRSEDKQKRHLAKCMVELKLQRQLHYYEEQDAAKPSKSGTDEMNKALRSHSSLSDSLLPSSTATTNDKQIWKAICKAASAMENNDDNRFNGDDSSVNRQVKKNVLKMLINNLQREGELETDNSRSGKGSSSVITHVGSTVRKPRSQRQNSTCSDLSADDWDTCSEITNPDLRPWKQNSFKKFFTTCLTTLQDEGEDNIEDDCSTIKFVEVKK